MLINAIPQTDVTASAFAYVQKVALALGDFAFRATEEQIFWALIIYGVVLGIALQLFLPKLIANKRRFKVAIIMLCYSTLLGRVAYNHGIATAFWLSLATVGGALLTRGFTYRPVKHLSPWSKGF